RRPGGRSDGGRAASRFPHLAPRDRRGATDQEVNKADEKIERAADWLQQQADASAGQPGLKGKLAQPLADDAEFLRKLKPSLIAARARGEAPTNQKPGEGTVAPSGPQLGSRPKPAKKGGAGGPNP